MYRIHSRRSVRLSFALALMGLLLPAGTARCQQQPPPKIVDITVLGNKNINRESILTASGLKVGDPLTQTALDEARRRLLDTGNFGAHHQDEPDLAVQIKADLSAEGARVVIEVDENDKVQGINVTGAGPIPVADVLAQLNTKVGDVLNLNTLHSDMLRVQKYYEDRGYQMFISEGFEMTNGILNIPIVVGKITKVKITGLRKTRQWVVTREMQQKPGAYYNVKQLRKDLTNLYNTNLFENIEPTFQFPPPPAPPGQVEINLNIQEKRTGTVTAGVGYSSRQTLIGRAELTEDNFLGRGQQVSLVWETGGRANRNSFDLGFTEPWLDRRHTSLSVNLFDRAVYRFSQSIGGVSGTPTVGTGTDYYETHTGGQITVSRPFGATMRGFVGLRYDHVKVPALDINLNDAAVLQNGPLTTLTFRVSNNTRDFDMDPAVGGFDTVTFDVGRADLKPVQTLSGQTPQGVFGILNYTRISIDLRRYFSPKGRRQKPTDKRNVFALRLMLGTSTGILPFSEQYFVGGAETLRGYNEDRFWGKNMILGSVEFRTPLANALTGVIFTDVGDAWGGAYENVSLNNFKQHGGFDPSVGVGVGLRVVTPIGPIRIDQGFGREGARTHFSIGHVF